MVMHSPAEVVDVSCPQLQTVLLTGDVTTGESFLKHSWREGEREEGGEGGKGEEGEGEG